MNTKKVLTTMLLMSFLFVLNSCTTQEELSNFETLNLGLVEEDTCESRDTEACELDDKCQLVSDDNMIPYACTDIPSEDDEGSGDENPYDEHACDPGIGNGAGHVHICHFPPGNHAAAHTICVGLPGWINGHELHHDKDHLGVCTHEDLNQ